MIIIIDTLSWKETSLFGSNARKLVHEKEFLKYPNLMT